MASSKGEGGGLYCTISVQAREEGLSRAWANWVKYEDSTFRHEPLVILRPEATWGACRTSPAAAKPAVDP